MKTISISAIIAASVLFGGAAYAGDTYIQIAPQLPKGETEYKPVLVNPMDYSDINQSPIRGKGQIRVVHNEPAPDAAEAEAELIKAAWLLKDNGWQVFKPNGRRQ